MAEVPSVPLAVAVVMEELHLAPASELDSMVQVLFLDVLFHGPHSLTDPLLLRIRCFLDHLSR